jgi:hypothetical protein
MVDHPIDHDRSRGSIDHSINHERSIGSIMTDQYDQSIMIDQ